MNAGNRLVYAAAEGDALRSVLRDLLDELPAACDLDRRWCSVHQSKATRTGAPSHCSLGEAIAVARTLLYGSETPR